MYVMDARGGKCRVGGKKCKLERLATGSARQEFWPQLVQWQESLSLSRQKTLFLQKGLKFKQPQCNVDRSAIKSDNDEERNDEGESV